MPLAAVCASVLTLFLAARGGAAAARAVFLGRTGARTRPGARRARRGTRRGAPRSISSRRADCASSSHSPQPAQRCRRCCELHLTHATLPALDRSVRLLRDAIGPADPALQPGRWLASSRRRPCAPDGGTGDGCELGCAGRLARCAAIRRRPAPSSASVAELPPWRAPRVGEFSLQGHWASESEGQGHAVFNAEGMRCAQLRRSIRTGLGALPGVTGTEVNVVNGRVSVSWEPARVSLGASCDGRGARLPPRAAGRRRRRGRATRRTSRGASSASASPASARCR